MLLKFLPKSYLNRITAPAHPYTTDSVMYMPLFSLVAPAGPLPPMKTLLIFCVNTIYFLSPVANWRKNAIFKMSHYLALLIGNGQRRETVYTSLASTLVEERNFCLFLGSGPDRRQNPVEWGDFLSICLSVSPSVRPPPLGHPARPEAQPAIPEA